MIGIAHAFAYCYAVVVIAVLLHHGCYGAWRAGAVGQDSYQFFLPYQRILEIFPRAAGE